MNDLFGQFAPIIVFHGKHHLCTDHPAQQPAIRLGIFNGQQNGQLEINLLTATAGDR